MSLVTKRLGKRTAVKFGQGIRASSTFRIEEPGPEVKETAWKLFTTQLDKDYDLVDCLSFALMEAFAIREAFGFDRHFAQYGFDLLPGRKGR
jgi:predicted nucleic acid-binding protein